MPKLYRLDASIRADQSVTRSLADAFAAGADDAFSDVIHREVGTTPLPAPAWRDAVTSMWTPPEQLTTGQENARALAAELADELISADVFLRHSALQFWSCAPCKGMDRPRSFRATLRTRSKAAT